MTKMNMMKVTIMLPSPPADCEDSPQRNSRGLTWEEVRLTWIRATMATMRMRFVMTRKQHSKLMLSQRRMGRTELGTQNVDRYGCHDGDEAHTDAEDEASQADDGATHHVEDCGYRN
jgi:hypothetical protein